MKKRNVLVLGVTAVSCFTLLTSFTSEDPVDTSSVSEPGVSSETVSSEVSEATSSSEFFTYEDKNGNGIPDEIEDYYDEHIRDQYVFGISMGALISGAIYIFTLVYKWRKDKKFDTATLEKIGELVKDTTEYQATIATMKAEYEKLDKSYREATDRFIAESNETQKALAEATERLSKYSETDEKLNAILDNQELMTHNADDTKSGVSQKVSENVRGVK